jgi:hypothetical protein
MTDVDLEQLHRRTEGWAWRFLVAALAVGGVALWRDWSEVVAWLVMLPLMAVAVACHLALYPMRWVMDRRGIDWDHP